MLADFPVATSLEGERYVIVCRDIATAVFFYEYPDVPLLTECSDKESAEAQRRNWSQTMQWLRGVLVRATVEPPLTLELVNRLDAGALEAILGYAHAVGYWSDEQLQKQAAEPGDRGESTRAYLRTLGAMADEILPAPAIVAPRFGAVHMPFVRDLAPNVRRRVAELAAKTGVRPSAILNSPISETLLDYRILRDAQQYSSDPAYQLTGDDARIGYA